MIKMHYSPWYLINKQMIEAKAHRQKYTFNAYFSHIPHQYKLEWCSVNKISIIFNRNMNMIMMPTKKKLLSILITTSKINYHNNNQHQRNN